MAVTNLHTWTNSDYFPTYSTGFGRFTLTKHEQSEYSSLQNKDHMEKLWQQ